MKEQNVMHTPIPLTKKCVNEEDWPMIGHPISHLPPYLFDEEKNEKVMEAFRKLAKELETKQHIQPLVVNGVKVELLTAQPPTKEQTKEMGKCVRYHPKDCPIVKAVEGLEYQIIPPSHKGEWE